MKTIIRTLITFLIFFIFPSYSIAAKPKELRVYLIPTEAPDIVVKKHQPLADYLKKRLGVEVKLTVPPTYPEVIEAIEKGQADLSYLGALTYLQAKEKVPDIEPIVTAQAIHTTVIITRKGSGIKSIKELKGKTFAFGSESSTSGHLVPRGDLLSSGIDPSKDFARFIFAGGHDKVAFAVAKGEIDAGALYKPVFDRLVSEGKVSDKDVMVIWESPPFADFPWVASGRLDKGFKKEIKDAFLTLNDPKILDPLKATGYREVSASLFDKIKEYAEKLGFIKPATKKGEAPGGGADDIGMGY